MYARLQLILLITFLISFNLMGQESALFVVDKLFCQSGNESTFILNGQDISKSCHSIRIQINDDGFDTLRYLQNDILVHEAYMKLRANETYELNRNSCSFYTLEPSINATQGSIEFSVECKVDTSFLVGIGEFVELNNGQADERRFYLASAMCLFSAKLIEVKNMDEQTVVGIKFHFLHGEQLKVIFNADEGMSSMNITDLR